jgi:hypothetical protein
MSAVRHIVVSRAISSVRFAPDEAPTFNDVPLGDQRAIVVVRTRYSVEGFTNPVPRELWIETTGALGSLDQALGHLTDASGMVLAAIAFCANAPIAEPEPELAFEIHEGGTEHKLYQRYVTQESGLPSAHRRAPMTAIIVFVRAWLAHAGAERIHSAITHYALALRHCASGREIFAHAHFYMAVESLTKVLLRDECLRHAMDESELAAHWGIAKGDLDDEIRLRRVFGLDQDSYRAAKKTSDGFNLNPAVGRRVEG